MREHMQQMQAQMSKIQQTQDPQERQRLLQEHWTAMQAAMTGHFVMASIHANDSLAVAPRLLDLGIEPFLLASSLALAAAQRLVRVLCSNCKKPYKPRPEDLERCFKESLLEKPPDPSQVVFYQARGCDKCARTGYVGRKAIFEVYRINREMRDIITKYGADLAKLREVAFKAGMWNLRASGWRKVLQGITTAEEVLSVTTGE